MSSNFSTQMEIKVKGFNWKKKMLITGYYQFEIVIRNKGNSAQETTIFRRFSEIEWLHEGLLKHNPGCLIPNLLEKNFWCNLSVNNSLELEKRKQTIEVYLNYIISHKYLSSNPCFVKFISNSFTSDTIKEDKPSLGIFNALYGISSYIPYLKSNSKSKSIKYIEDNSSALIIEKENFMRLKVGIESLLDNIREHIRINEDKVKSLNALLSTAKEVNYASLDYKAYTSINSNINIDEDEQIEENQLKHDKKLTNDIERINSLYERNRTYQNVLESSIVDQIIKYKIKLEGLIEIFERKKVQDSIYHKLLKGEGVTTTKENDIAIQKELMDNLIEQFNDEIDNFKEISENDIVNIINKFLRDKLESDADIAEIYSSSK